MCGPISRAPLRAAARFFIRQLDMAMADAGLVAHFTAKLRADLDNLLRPVEGTGGQLSPDFSGKRRLLT